LFALEAVAAITIMESNKTTILNQLNGNIHNEDGSTDVKRCYNNEIGCIPAVAKTVSLLMHNGLFFDDKVKRISGSLPRKSPNKNRCFEVAYQRLIDEYFSGYMSIYNEAVYSLVYVKKYKSRVC
jgi:hypothetical protein